MKLSKKDLSKYHRIGLVRNQTYMKYMLSWAGRITYTRGSHKLYHSSIEVTDIMNVMYNVVSRELISIKRIV